MDLYAIRNELAQGRSIYDLDLRVTFYARVSSDSNEQLHSLQAQSEYFQQFISTSDNWQYVEGYIDEGISGTSVSKRGSFLRMIDDAHQGKFDFIITKEVSRFARNTLDSIKYTQDLLAHGIGVFFQSDNINTLMPDSELRLTIMASVAQDEVRKTSERVKFGFRRAIEKGVVLGSDRIWGYKKDHGKLVIVEQEAEMVRKIYQLFAIDNLGMRAIAQRLTEEGYRNSHNKPLSFSTISGILSNPKYKGYYCGNKTHKIDYKLDKVKYLDQAEWVLYRDTEKVPPIVSEELWEKAAQIRARRSKKYGKSAANNRYPYSSKIICQQHQVPFYRSVYKYRQGEREVWQCREYAQKGRAGCLAPVIYTDELDQLMRRCLRSVLPPPEQIICHLLAIYRQISEQSQAKAVMSSLAAELEKLRQRKDRLLDLNICGHISDEEFSERNQRFNGQLAELNNKLHHLQAAAAQDGDVNRREKHIRQIAAEELAFPSGFTNAVIAVLLERIEIETLNDGRASLHVFLKKGLWQQEPIKKGPSETDCPDFAANRQVQGEQGSAAESGEAEKNSAVAETRAAEANEGAEANKTADKTSGADSNRQEEQNAGVFWGSASLSSKPRLLLLVTEDTYHPCRYQHRDNPTDRHGEAV